MSPKPEHSLPLESLLLLLQTEGFVIGVDTYVQVQKLLLYLGTGEKQLDEFGRLLRPLVAKNPEQQKLFDKVWAQYLQGIQKRKVLTTPVDEKEKTKKTPEEKKLRLLKLVAWAVGLAALLIASYFIYQYFIQTPPPKLSIGTNKESYLIGEEVKLKLNGLDSTGLKENQAIVWQVGETTKDTTQALDYVTLFRNTGTKTISVQLIGTNLPAEEALISKASTTLQIACPPDNSLQPAFSVIADEKIGINETVSFSNETVNNSSLPLYYRWDYGNGNTSKGFEPEPQQYENADSYTVTLTVSKDSTFTDPCQRFTTTEVVTVELAKTKIVLKPLSLAKADESNISVFYTTKGKLYLLMFLVLLVVLWFLLKYRERKKKEPTHLKRLLQTSDQPPLSIPYPEKEEAVKPEKAFYELANGMRQRLEGTAARLDVQSTIKATAKAGGFPNFQFKLSTKPPEYLILKQKGAQNDHLSRLFDLLIKMLASEDLYIEVYHYKQSPLQCYHPLTGEKRSLEQLAMQFPNHRLLIFGNGQGLLENKYPKLKTGVAAILRTWQERALVTPQPLVQWGYKEDLLKGVLRIFPADLQALLHLMEPLAIEDQGSLAQLQKNYSAEETTEYKRIDFYDTNALKDYFEKIGAGRLYQWLCATMVYPTPTWELVLHIGQALEAKNKVEVNYANLLQLARIPWLQDGDVPFELRQSLLQELTPENEQLARQAIVDMLETLGLDEDSFAYEEAETLKLTNRFLLKPQDPDNQRAVYWLWKNNLLPDAHVQQALEQQAPILNKAPGMKKLAAKHRSLQPMPMAIVSVVLLVLGIYLFTNEVRVTAYNDAGDLVSKEWAYEKLPEAVRFNNLAADTTAKGLYLEASILMTNAQRNINDTSALAKLIETNSDKAAYNLSIDVFKSEVYAGLYQTLVGGTDVDSLRNYYRHAQGAAYYMLDSMNLAKANLDSILASDPAFFERQPKPHLFSVLGSENTGPKPLDEFAPIRDLLAQGRDLIERQAWEEAMNTLSEINQLDYGLMGAEAQYLIAYALNQQEQYSQSNDALQRSLTTFLEFSEWTERSRLLQAQNYVALGETERARNLLDGIIANTYLLEVRVAAQKALDGLGGMQAELPPPYVSAIQEGDAALDKKALSISLEKYQNALNIVPNDEYAQNAVEEIQLLQNDQQAGRSTFMGLLFLKGSDYKMQGNPTYTWAKAGYYNQYGDIYVGVNQVDRQNEQVTFELRKSEQRGRAVIQTLTLKVGDSQDVLDGDTYYQLYLNRLGKAGKNPFNTAAFYTIATYKKEGNTDPTDIPLPEMVFVQGGTFEMGSNDGEDNEKPIHPVTLNDFYIGKYEVTNAKYAAFLNAYGSEKVKSGEYAGETMIEEYKWGIQKVNDSWQPAKGYDNHPVVKVSWYGANEYTKWLSQETGQNYRLPTEAEWEYAARGGQKSQGYTYAGSNDLAEVAWYNENSNRQSYPVGKKAPNELGLYDMSGNVWEWCADWYGEDYYASRPKNNPQGAFSGATRVLRGGSWNFSNFNSRVANRLRLNPPDRFNYLGFRLSRGL